MRSVPGRRAAGALLLMLLTAPMAVVAGPPPEPAFEDCYNGIDDDGDGLIDQEDPDCLVGHGGFVFVFDDLNANGYRDQGEPGIAGWEIHFIGANGHHSHMLTEVDGGLRFNPSPGLQLICETLPATWIQTAPSGGQDCAGHTHGGAITPGPRGFSGSEPGPEFGNTRCRRGKISSNARAYGLRADLLGGGVLPSDPDQGPTPDSDVVNPDSLLSIPDLFDASRPPMVDALSVFEHEDARMSVAAARTGVLSLRLPGLEDFHVQANSVHVRSGSLAGPLGVSSTSGGSKVANLRIGGVQYGDVNEPLHVAIDDPLNPGTPFIEVRVLEHIRRHAAAGITQPVSGLGRSGLDVNGIHIVVHDLPLTSFLDESTDIIIGHASSDFTESANAACPSVSGGAFAAKMLEVSPDHAETAIGEVVLPSTGGMVSESHAEADLGLLRVEGASATAEGQVLSPGAAQAQAEVSISAAAVEGLLAARLIEAKASATCESPPGAPASCSNRTTGGESLLDGATILGVDVCGHLPSQTSCAPPPNTVIHVAGVVRGVLNEQIADPGGRGLTVNAMHIWVLKALPNSLVPAGAEVIVGSVHAAAHPRPT